jgi:phosphoenolpyruvate-protein kinase (PTS system EI component)
MLTGIPASSGAAIGPFFLLNTNIPVADAQQSQLSAQQETQALTAAIAQSGRRFRCTCWPHNWRAA